MKKYIYSALLYSDDYLPGVIGLVQSLKTTQAHFSFFLLADENLKNETFNILEKEGIYYQKIKTYQINHRISRWNKTINYFQYWNYIEYDKICVLDLDVILLNNIDKVFEDNDSDFSALDLYTNDNYFFYNKDQIHTSLTLIKPKEGYWDYIYNKYCNSNLLEEQILYREFFNKKNFSYLSKKYINDYYHDTRAQKYWIRYDIKDYKQFVINYINNYHSEQKCYTTIYNNWKDIKKVLLMNYRIKKLSKNNFLVLLKEKDKKVENILKSESINYKIIPELTNNFFSIFYSLKEYKKVVFLKNLLYINSSPDFLFDYPDGSAYYSKRNITPEGKVLANDLIMVFEPKNHDENFYTINYLLNDLPQERIPISHLWFHINTNKAYQITDDFIGYWYEDGTKPLLVMSDNERYKEISKILEKYSILY